MNKNHGSIKDYLFHLVKHSIRGKDETALDDCPVKSEKGNPHTHFCKNVNCLIRFDSYNFFIAVLDLQVRTVHLKDSIIQKFFSFHHLVNHCSLVKKNSRVISILKRRMEKRNQVYNITIPCQFLTEHHKWEHCHIWT